MIHSCRRSLHAAFAMAALLGLSTSHAALTDLASAPMADNASHLVKPNIMFILDDSGSMAWEFLPDAARNFGYDRYGARSKHCNGLYYDPEKLYRPPVSAAATSYQNANFSAAAHDGFKSDSDTVNLDGSFYFKYLGKEKDLDFEFDAEGNLAVNTFFRECLKKIGTQPTVDKFEKVIVGASSGPGGTDERVNFANWYSYYRTRMLMMKTAAGHAFKSVDGNYRVGLTTINYTGTRNTHPEFLDAAEFHGDHKSSWYEKFYNVSPEGSTPLRAALSKVGRIYGGKAGNDPVQYSCQQNATILSTDGYWNSSAGYQLDGTTSVGHQDGGDTPAPMRDAASAEDTLSDVAMYYYRTDLRTPALGNCTGPHGADLCRNNVLQSDQDNATHQHMTTFTLGLGVDGTLQYAEDYLSGGSADYEAIRQGQRQWPAPESDKQTTIDDLWHAAVNGRGAYFSARSPEALETGIRKALDHIKARRSAGSSVALSNFRPVAGDNFVYLPLYWSGKWEGDLEKRTIDPQTGRVAVDRLWSAQSLLNNKVAQDSDTRSIYTWASGDSGLRRFRWDNLSAAEKAHFSDPCGTGKGLSQCPWLTESQKSVQASGEALVNYLRGQHGYEDREGRSRERRIFRSRGRVLGDIIGAEPVVVKKSPFRYLDTNHATFRDEVQARRRAVVYVAANDGMLHAFDDETGGELWAYVPSMVLPELYRLADSRYAANHRYYVDGTPVVGDICPSAPAAACSAAQWKTILVGGLNGGGRGYYALDITNPGSPAALWNFTPAHDADLGYSYGNPVITKRADGTWVAVFASGYNNVSPGDGKGYLYVLNAATGRLLEKIATNAGSEQTPAGLAKINAWVNSPMDNTARRYYGGDLLGNVWRFDIDNTTAPDGKEAVRIAELGNAGSVGVQPVTIRPQLSEVTEGGESHALVHVATGRYLGASDLADRSQQSIYTFRDNLAASGLGRLRTHPGMVRQTLTTRSMDGVDVRTASTREVDWTNHSGWYVDLNPGNQSPGERVNVAMQQQLGVLTVAANVPSTDACSVDGYAWLYQFDARTGRHVSASATTPVGQKHESGTFAVGTAAYELASGAGSLSTNSKGDVLPHPGGQFIDGRVKRVSWRELQD